MWYNDLVKGQIEVQNFEGARILHGYLLNETYMWFYSGIDYSGTLIAVRQVDLNQCISRAIHKHKNEYGTKVSYYTGNEIKEICLDVEGCGVYDGNFMHYSEALNRIIPHE